MEFPGNFIGTQNTANTNYLSGVHSLYEVGQGVSDGTWPTNFKINQSLRLGGSYLSIAKDHASTTATFSFWVKPDEVADGHIYHARSSTSSSVNRFYVNIQSTSTLQVIMYNSSASIEGLLQTSDLFRDFHAWYHFVISLDTTQSIESDRIPIYVNNRKLTDYGSETYPSQYFQIPLIDNPNTNIGRNTGGSTHDYYGYISEFNFIDGLALDSSYFGFTHPTTKKWLPKKYTGEYGDNGFHLDFAGTNVGTGAVGTVGEDKSGNGNHFTSNSIASHDVVPDSPTNNFVTLSPLTFRDNNPSQAPTLSEGNLKIYNPSTSASYYGYSSIKVPSYGKWYFECVMTVNGGSTDVLRLRDESHSVTSSVETGFFNPSTNAVVGVFIDHDSGYVGSTTTSTFKAYNILPIEYYIVCLLGTQSYWVLNFGQDATFAGAKTPTQVYTDANGRGQFFYEPPAGALALCSANLEQAKNTPTEYITDETNKHIITYNGGARVSKFSPYATDGYSVYFNGDNSDTIVVDYDSSGTTPPDSIKWLHDGYGEGGSPTSTSDHTGTIEAWLYPTKAGTADTSGTNSYYFPCIMSVGNTWLSFGVNENNKLRFYWWTGAQNHITGTGLVQLNKWNHVAVVINGTGAGNLKFYLNGVEGTDGTTEYTGAIWGTASDGLKHMIGGCSTGYGSSSHQMFYGHIAELRIIPNVALYTSNFTPPTEPLTAITGTRFLLSTNSNRFLDSSSPALSVENNNGTPKISDYSPYAKPNTVTQDLSIAGGSFQYDGTNDGISIPNTTDIQPSVSDFTVELWFYQKAYPSTFGALYVQGDSGIYSPINISTTAAGEISFYSSINGTSFAVSIEAGTVVNNVWNHVAVSRDVGSGTASVWLNGTRIATTSTLGSTALMTPTQPLSSGVRPSGDQDVTGYVTDIRFVKGKYVYDPASTTITVPTAPLTQTSKTKLLLQPYSKVKQSDGVYKNIDNYNQDEIGGKLTHNGSQIVDASPYSKGDDIGSLLFDGVDDILLLPTISAVGTSDFTIEMWFKEVVDASSTYDGFLSLHAGAGPTVDRVQIAVHNGVLHYYSGNWYSTGWSPTTRKWHHVAFVRDYSAPTFKLYVDGTEEYSLTSVVANRDFGSDWTGNLNRMGVHSSYNNYLATDVRITKQALYTGAFTPPKYPFTSDKYVTDGTNQSATGPSTTTTYTVTVASGTKYDGTTGNRYVIDGEPFETVTLHRGSTYRFDVSDSSFGGNGHPFRFSSNENNSPSAAYTTGVTVSGDGGSADAYVEIVVANDAPDNLYYYCTNHSGMGGTIKVEGGRTITADSVVLHIQPGKKEQKSEVFEFASLNKLNYSGTGITLANNGYSVTSTAAHSVHSSFSVSSGKWYVEASGTGTNGAYVGVQEANTASPAPTYSVTLSNLASQGIGLWTKNGNIYGGNGTSAISLISAPGTTLNATDVVAMAIDMDASPKTVQWLVNNTRVITVKLGSTEYIAADGTTGTATATFADISNLYITYNGGNSDSNTGDWNFGQDPTILGNVTPSGGTNADNGFPDEDGNGSFRYAPPSGYKAMGRLQKPAQVVSDAAQHPENYFNTLLYDGNGDTQSITGLDFQPDLVWIKPRSLAYQHQWYDSVRGALKRIGSSLTNAENTETQTLTSFTSSGFTVGNDGGVNAAGSTNVAWCWKAGDTIVPNTNGTTPSVVSVNKDAGFSIVKWNSPGGTAGATYIGHGLDKKPDIVFVKSLEASENWHVYYSFIDGSNDYVYLNLTDAKRDSSQPVATSDYFYWSGGTGNDYIAYCWHSVPGFSKFGSYTGNGNADGPFVYLGFKPACWLVKNIDVSNNWYIYDSKRDGPNPTGLRLYPNLSNAEGGATDGEDFDFLSNGIKVRYSSDQAFNANGQKIIYMAFAEAPFTRTSAK